MVLPLLLCSYLYFKNKYTLYTHTVGYTVAPSLLQKPTNESKTGYIFSDPNISFEYPLEWDINDRNKSYPFLRSFDFTSKCNQNRIVSFTYKVTNLNNPMSLDLGQKNPNGPTIQTTKIININGITLGENIQPVGDGSGGYEPKAVVDFLSKSRKYHYYFIAVAGCRSSFEETYQFDLLPILNSIKLLD